MGKMSDMAVAIEELLNAAAVIKGTADWLAGQFTAEPEKQEKAPEPKRELKLEDVRAVLADLSRKGHTDEIRGLLQKYGASKLSGIDPKHYEALLKDAEGLDHAE